MHNGNGHHEASGPLATPQDLLEEIIHRSQRVGGAFAIALVVFGALFLLGVVGFFLKAAGGFDDHRPWGYYAVTFFLILSTFQAMPIAAIGPRLMKGTWRRPTSRLAELGAVAGLLNFFLFIPLLIILPPLEDRRSLWLSFPGGPYVWDTLILFLLTVCGLALVAASALPDLAAARDHATGLRHSLGLRFASWWRGTPHQWRVHKAVLSLLGVFYMMLYGTTHAVLVIEFSIALVPGWKDSVFPLFHAVTGLQAGLATLFVIMFLHRTLGGYHRYLRLEQFWNFAKVLLALTLFWFYLWWSGFVIFWYGRLPVESDTIRLLQFGGAYQPFFLGALAFSFIIPFLLIIWNPIRKSILGPVVISCFILVGIILDRIRIYVSSFSVEDVTGHRLTALPNVTPPDAADVMILVGGISGAIFLYMVATKVVPPISLWEMQQALLIRVARPYLRGAFHVLAKPE